MKYQSSVYQGRLDTNNGSIMERYQNHLTKHKIVIRIEQIIIISEKVNQ